MKNTAILLLLCCSAVAMASGGEPAATGHGEEHIPLREIGWQAANLGILLVAIFFFIKSSIKETFQNRQKEYLEKAEKTKGALKDAEAALAGIKERLSLLESGEQKSLERAQQEAKILMANIIKDAELSAEKIKKDTVLAINNELNKAKAEINSSILDLALAAATKELTDKNQTNAGAREAQFVKQLEQVKA